ncbi:hypothetical protein PoB_002520700 [Plakobranchus ocellatus]|uniref:Uncharacterized protein n=1 Tax=Plakobranchus ocellatus TaxID=259542 RepID=A0AAV3ZUC6_9GAST|nr:hypothetical protein PoB_002520700 [Plakobranchus ocellatus]
MVGNPWFSLTLNKEATECLKRSWGTCCLTNLSQEDISFWNEKHDASLLIHNLDKKKEGINVEEQGPRRERKCMCVCVASQQQDDLRLSGPPSGQGAGGGARTRDRRIPADIRADSLATVPPTPRSGEKMIVGHRFTTPGKDPTRTALLGEDKS